jgi:L-rhamnose-H+ transport protein
MGVLLGVFLHFVGGFASGSFYIPYKKVISWHWESYWLAGGLFSWLIAPWLAAYLIVPGFWHIIGSVDHATLFWTYCMGVLWGIGGLTFGLSMRYLGMSLGMAIALGYCAAFGTLIPPLYYDIMGSPGQTTLSSLWHSPSGRVILGGVLICLVGIAICGKAGVMKEKDLGDSQSKGTIQEFNLRKGVLVATVSGILSACFSFGLAFAKPISSLTQKSGVNPIFENIPSLVVILLGGLTTNFIWCFILNVKNKSYGDYTNRQTPLLRNYFFCVIAGVTWYLQFFFYGMGSSKMGKYDFSSWTFHMAFIIIVSNLWGIYFKEWKGSQKNTMRVIALGIATVILSTLVVGLGNYMASIHQQP